MARRDHSALKVSFQIIARIIQCANRNIAARYVPYIGLMILMLYGFITTQPKASTATQISVKKSRDGETASGQEYPLQVRESNLEIIKKSVPVEISYKAAAGDRKEDPPDETELRRNPPEYNLTGDALLDACRIRDSDYKMIHDKVSIDPTMRAKIQEEREKGNSMHLRILCVVQTSGHRHAERIPVLRQTWGPKCDGFVVASNVTDPLLGTVRIPHGGDEVYLRQWLRVKATWSFIYDNYYQGYDWFFFSNDMVLLLVENLRHYLESDEIKAASNYANNNASSTSTNGDSESRQQTPLFLGRRFALGGDMNDIFNAGGPGYVLNKAALKLFVLESGDHPPQQHTSKEDLMIARTFRLFGVYPYDTQDGTGGERFMVTTPGHHYESQFPAWYHKQSIDIQHGKDHCAERSISFHYVPVDLMYRLYALLYDMCPPTK